MIELILRMARVAPAEGIRVIRFAMVSAAIVVLAGSSGAATQFTAESRDLRQSDPKPKHSVLWLDGGLLRLETDGENTVIYRGDRDLAWLIDHRDKSYRAIDRETTESVAQGVGQANTAARRYLEMLPPTQREAAERLLDQTLGSPTVVSQDIELHATGAVESIAGVSCAIYEIRRAGGRRAEVCRASFEAASIDAATREALRALTRTLRSVLPSLAPEAFRQDGVDAVHAFDELDGVPLRVRLFEKGVPVWETHVADVVRRAAPATAFELPDGYERRIALGAPSQAAPADRSP